MFPNTFNNILNILYSHSIQKLCITTYFQPTDFNLTAPSIPLNLICNKKTDAKYDNSILYIRFPLLRFNTVVFATLKSFNVFKPQLPR